jgi:general stress protein 26
VSQQDGAIRSKEPTLAKQQEPKKVSISKKKLADIMKDIDICMMTTVGAYGHLHSRPMSNNRNVTWDGDTWFFSRSDSSQVKEIERDANVNLAYSVPDEILFVSVTGRGEIVKDDQKKKELWYEELERWFPKGPEDSEIVLIRVQGRKAAYWGKDGDAELEL